MPNHACQWWRNLLQLRTLGPATVASATGHNLPPALQKKSEDAIRRRCRKFIGGFGTKGGTLMRGRAGFLDRELPKNGDIPKSRSLKNGSLMPSAGTI
jgi:hypothetical protein